MQVRQVPATHLINEDDWEHLSLERWATTVYAQVDSLVQYQKHADRIRKGGIHLLLDDESIRDMERRLGAMEMMQSTSVPDNSVSGLSNVIDGQTSPVGAEEFRRASGLQAICIEVYRRGISKEARILIWPYLTGIYPWNASEQQLIDIRYDLKQRYLSLRNRWKLIVETNSEPDKEWLHALLQERKYRIEKDVVRTDGSSQFYRQLADGTVDEDINASYDIDHGSSVAIEKALLKYPKWAQLRDILMTFASYRLDIGYVQGMSDIAAAIHQNLSSHGEGGFMDDEGVESLIFWIFAHFLETHHSSNYEFRGMHAKLPLFNNFHLDQGGLRTRLILVLYLMRIIEPEFYEKLDTIDSAVSSMGFSHHTNGAKSLFWLFRSILLHFSRDIRSEGEDLMFLWDGMLAGVYCKSVWMDVWVSLAIIVEYVKPELFQFDSFKKSSSEEVQSPLDSFEGLLKLMQRLSGTMDARRLLNSASELYNRFKLLVKPPSLSIDIHPNTTADHAKVYWDADTELSLHKDDLAELEAKASKMLINDVDISVDEAICMLNTHIKLPSHIDRSE